MVNNGQTTPKEEGLRKLDENRSGYWIGNMEGGRDMIYIIGVNPQMRALKIFWELMAEARLENLRCPISVDGR